MREVLEHMDGYVIALTPFYKMEEADWIVLRLLRCCARRTLKNTPDMDKTIDYLEGKYGYPLVSACWKELMKETEPNEERM